MESRGLVMFALGVLMVSGATYRYFRVKSTLLPVFLDRNAAQVVFGILGMVTVVIGALLMFGIDVVVLLFAER